MSRYNRAMRNVAIVLVSLVLFVRCGEPPLAIGEPCQLSSGTLGFGIVDPCQTQCLQNMEILCPDGSSETKAVCAGQAECEPGSCPAGQACYSFEYPVDGGIYCVPDDICGVAPASAAQRVTWERESRERKDVVSARYEKKQRTGDRPKPSQPTAPAAVAAPANVEPSSPPTTHTTRADEATASVLVDAWDFDLALIVCVEGDNVDVGEACAKHLPSGTEVQHGSWRLRLTGPKVLDCMPMSTTVPGVAGEQVGVADVIGERWGWLPEPPPAWRPVQPEPLDPVLEAVIKREMRELPANARFEQAVHADVDGDPHAERIVNVLIPSGDPEKRGYSQLWLIDDASVAPLDTTGLEVNGAIQVRGIVPLAAGGSLVVFTSEWMGGSGVHVMGPTDGRLSALAEAACGS